MPQIASTALASVVLITTFITLVFYIVGLSAYARERVPVVINTRWQTVSAADNTTLYAGLRAFVLEQPDGDTTLYRYETCPFSFCAPCRDSGRVAFGVLLVGAFFAFVTLALALPGLENKPYGIKITVIMTTFITGICGIISFGFYGISCYDQIEAAVVSGTTVEWSTGAALVLTGFSLMFFGWVAAMGDAGLPSEEPQSSQPEQQTGTRA
jgi:hypothetical protein